MKVILSLFFLALCATIAPADSCRQRVVQHVQQVQAVDYQQQYATAVYVPLVVAVPQYSAGYTEALFGRGQPQQPASDPTLAELLQEVRKIRSEVEAIKAGNKPEIIPLPTPVPPNKIEPLPPLPEKAKVLESPPYLKVFQEKCASCHEGAFAEKKGAGFTLLDKGRLVALTAEQKLDIIERMYTGNMPREDKCTDEQVHQVVVGIGGRKKKS